MLNLLSNALFPYQPLVSKQQFSNLRSILRRRILPDLLKDADLQALPAQKLDYIFEQIPLAGFVAITEPILKKQLLQVANPGIQKVEKSQWKRFCTWLEAQEWYDPETAPIDPSLETSKPAYTHLPKGLKAAVIRLKKRQKTPAETFRLLEQAWSPHLRGQIQNFDHFCTTITQWRRRSMPPATLKTYHKSIQRLLGYRKKVQGLAPEALSLTDLLDVSVLQAYEAWSRERGISSNTIKLDLDVTVPIAQWSFHQAFPKESYRNPEPVKSVRAYRKTIIDRGDRPRVSDEACAERALSMSQCWEILCYLSWRCKDLERQHGVTTEVIDAWMDYLILAFLVTTGGRQREAREMAIKQLSVEENNVFMVTLPPEGHKTGNKTGKGRAYPLFVGPMRAEISADLQHYLNQIRPQNLGHDFLFFSRRNCSGKVKQSRRGDPIVNECYLSHLVPRLIACVTTHLYGIENTKWTAPHDFRRIMATWVCTYGKPEHLAIYAELLGHSMEMLVQIYNKMYPGALARQSLLAYDEIVAREKQVQALNTPGGSQQPTSIAHMSSTTLVDVLKKLVHKLWYSLTQRKRSELLEALTPAERELIES